MKKVLCTALVIVLLLASLALSACGGKAPNAENGAGYNTFDPNEADGEGNGDDYTPANTPNGTPTTPEPQGIKWKSVVGTHGLSNFYLAISTDGTLYAIGSTPGLLQTDGSVKTSGSPENPLKIAENVAAATIVNALYSYPYFLKTDGTLWSWGTGSNGGYIGDGTTMTRETPVQIADNVATLPSLAGIQYYSLFFRKIDGTLWTWIGDNLIAQEMNVYVDGNLLAPVLADTDYELCETVEYRLRPETDSYESGGTMLLDRDGTLYKWYNVRTFSGTEQIIYTQSKVADPQIVTTPFMTDVAMVKDAHNMSVYVLKKDGSLWGWGDNKYCQLGDGTNVERDEPIKIIDDIADFTVITQGTEVTVYAIKTDGTLWVWGSKSSYGFLGDGTDRQYADVPVQILEDVVSVSGSIFNMFAVKSDGTLWAWGQSRGNSPVQIISNAG
ncbi:MAG: hypothetical protein LBN02_10305 [Oscillospiraceae bacterium]|jgi:alpha-tubulin suppressor-like RCC1 family protein|nr:hypothetical protein [Oscillospiraceae bacterium]